MRASMMNIPNAFRRMLGYRKPDSHKGDYGRVFIVAGSLGMSGACVLAASGAIRAGAGLVTVGVPKCLMVPLAWRLTEAMTRPLSDTRDGSIALSAARSILEFSKSQDVVAIGPGLSQHLETQRLIRKVVTQTDQPVVLDADGLNAFVGHVNLLRRLKSQGIITPHPGEFTRLFGGSICRGQRERKRRAIEVAKRYGAVVVLKGYQTVVASPDGRVYINSTGNPGMATGGAGDVLTGITAAFRSVIQNDAFRAACFAVYVHGLAGDLAARQKGEMSLIASDIINFLPDAIQQITRSK